MKRATLAAVSCFCVSSTGLLGTYHEWLAEGASTRIDADPEVCSKGLQTWPIGSEES